MKGFSRRERRIISYAYHDAARICWEREMESMRDGIQEAKHMARQLKRIMGVRANMILRYGCDLPSKRKSEEISRLKEEP